MAETNETAETKRAKEIKPDKPAELEVMDPRLEKLRSRIIDNSFWGEVKRRLIPIAGDTTAVGIALAGLYFGFPLAATVAATAVGAGSHVAADLLTIKHDEGKEFDKMHAGNLSANNTHYGEWASAVKAIQQATSAPQTSLPAPFTQAALPAPAAPKALPAPTLKIAAPAPAAPAAPAAQEAKPAAPETPKQPAPVEAVITAATGTLPSPVTPAAPPLPTLKTAAV